MNSINILAVDDTPANLDLLEIVLDEAGYEIRTAISGDTALKSIEAHKPDLILLDIMMPGMDGYETCQIIKSNPDYKDIPIIFLSAKNQPEDKVKAFDVGGIDYLVKPFNISEILVRIKNHISLYVLQQELEQKLEIIDKNVITSSTDLDGFITEASEAFCNISGYKKNELIGQRHNILRHGDMDDSLYADLNKTISDNKTWRGEIKNRKKDGSFYWVDAIISPNYDLHGNKIGYTSIRQNITDKKRIEELSITDQLTGIYNRRHFNTMCPREINRAIRYGTKLSFAMLDIDFFKQYNDTYGHKAGDEVLVLVAKEMKKQLNRSEDLVFRLGGEEFGIIFNTTEQHEAEQIANKVRSAIEGLNIEHKGSNISSTLTVSIGITSVDYTIVGNYKLDMDYLYMSSDKELYNAKENGRNKVSFTTM